MKEDQRHAESAGGVVRRHQSMQRLSRSEAGNAQEDDPLMVGLKRFPFLLSCLKSLGVFF